MTRLVLFAALFMLAGLLPADSMANTTADATAKTMESSQTAHPPLVDGDWQAGKELAATVCAACHMPDGNSVNPVWPKLAEQHATYIVTQLKAFQTGDRSDPLMTAQAKALSEEQMHNVALWYSRQQILVGKANSNLVESGAAIFRTGIPEKGVPACAACHSPAGQGNAAAEYPLLGGQHAEYIVLALKSFASGKRKTDANKMMRTIAGRMNEQEMQAVAAFIEGLYPSVAGAKD